MIFVSYKLAYLKYLIDTLERIEQTNLMLDEKSFSLGTMNKLLHLEIFFFAIFLRTKRHEEDYLNIMLEIFYCE